MKYGEIKCPDIANGYGCRVSLFVSGCRHHCEGCFNPQTWDFKYGREFTVETADEILCLLRPGYIQGLTILGGETMEPENQGAVFRLLERVRKLADKDVWLYTGYTWEQLLDNKSRCHKEMTLPILMHTDVLVDGEFRMEEKDISLSFRGSRNQRLIDVKSSLQEGKVIEIGGRQRSGADGKHS